MLVNPEQLALQQNKSPKGGVGVSLVETLLPRPISSCRRNVTKQGIDWLQSTAV